MWVFPLEVNRRVGGVWTRRGAREVPMASCERLRTCGYTSSVRHPVQMIWLCGAPPAHTHRAQRVSRNALRARGRFTPHAGRATCTHAPPDDDAAVLLPCRATHTQPRAHRHQPLGGPRKRDHAQRACVLPPPCIRLGRIRTSIVWSLLVASLACVHCTPRQCDADSGVVEVL
jgi:hypothetical protein